MNTKTVRTTPMFYPRQLLQLVVVSMMVLSFLLSAVPNANGQQPNPLINQKDVFRFMEVMGALHYFYQLCKPQIKSPWREKTQILLKQLNLKPQAEQRLIARFNRSYRISREMYRRCVANANEIIDIYTKAIIKLSDKMASQIINQP